MKREIGYVYIQMHLNLLFANVNRRVQIQRKSHKIFVKQVILDATKNPRSRFVFTLIEKMLIVAGLVKEVSYYLRNNRRIIFRCRNN